MRIRSSFTQSILLFISLLLASQVFSYYAVFNYALMPSLQQFNKILAHELNLVLDEDGLLKSDAPLRHQLLENLGVTVHSVDSEMMNEFNHAMSIDLMSEEMTQELGSPTEVRLLLGSESYILWMRIDQLPNSIIRIPLSELQEEDFAPAVPQQLDHGASDHCWWLVVYPFAKPTFDCARKSRERSRSR